MQKALRELHRHGIDVVAISFSAPGRISWLQREFGLTFPILHDAERTWYEVLGARRGGWRTVFGPRILRRYVALMRRGYRLRYSSEDLRQLGGNVLLRRGEVVHRWVSDESERRPTIEQVLAMAGRIKRSGAR